MRWAELKETEEGQPGKQEETEKTGQDVIQRKTREGLVLSEVRLNEARKVSSWGWVCTERPWEG